MYRHAAVMSSILDCYYCKEPGTTTDTCIHSNTVLLILDSGHLLLLFHFLLLFLGLDHCSMLFLCMWIWALSTYSLKAEIALAPEGPDFNCDLNY